jgi:hypothetical protein
VIATVLVDTNVLTARMRERSPLATSYAKHLFGQRIASLRSPSPMPATAL